MPFKLRLKRSRQYNVVSKSLFVICVELLDSTTIECTLSAQSVGRECLDNVCQRLCLQQPEFFGLRYVSRLSNPQVRWVEMDRPLKRQLDKYAKESNLFLGVMYYVSDITLIKDEMTRYHYFLQLKSDVIEGRINCNPKQAVMLASYSMQAEFGDHDPERHTSEYLKDFALFPKHLIEDGHLESLTEAAICQHAALTGLASGTAEEHYILAAQQLDGYGQETFAAKIDSGSAAILGVCLSGIMAGFETNITKYYRWKDIANVINNKRYFIIECHCAEDTMQFQFSDPDSARYVWRMCVYQHTFFLQNVHAVEPSQGNSTNRLFDQSEFGENAPHLSSEGQEDQGTVTNSMPYGKDEMEHDPILINWAVPPIAQRAQSTSCLDLSASNDVDKLRALLPSYRPAPDYETAIQQKYGSGQAGGNMNQMIRPNPIGLMYSSQPEIHQTHLQEMLDLRSFPHYKHYPDVTQVERIYLDSNKQTMLKNDDHVHNFVPGIHTYSTPELDTVENSIIRGLQMLHLYKPPPPYPISNSTPDLACQTGSPTCPPQISMQHASGSSPDLVSSRSLGKARHFLDSATHSKLLPSPDAYRTYTNLAAVGNTSLKQEQGYKDYSPSEDPNILYGVSGLNEQTDGGGHVQPGVVHATNLAGLSDHHLQHHQFASTGANLHTEKVQESFLGQQNHIGSVLPYPVSSVSNITQYNVTEPIYENVPLPWMDNNVGLRSRTSSIQSAPEMRMMGSGGPNMVVGSKPNAVVSKAESSAINHPVYSSEQYFMTRHTSQEFPPGALLPLQQEPGSSSASPSSDRFLQSSREMPPPGEMRKLKRRKWALLVGGKNKTNTKSHKHGVKDENLPEGIMAESELLPQWNVPVGRLPLTATIPRDTMCQLLEKKLADSQLFFEFEKIPKKKGNADFSTACHPDNMIRNRYKDVLPYEDNRVRLSPSKDNKYGYINASHIAASIGSQQRFYIAAQGPLPSTLSDFWQMIWESDIRLVVMLCGKQEETTAYSPFSASQQMELSEFQIWRQFSQETGHCITTKLRLFNKASRQYRPIWHLQYTEWGDQGCPHSTSHFLGFLEELNSVRVHTMSEIPARHNQNPPLVVHCSAGVGRTGVTILSDLLLAALDHNQELDIPRVVAHIRQQRMLMVQTIAQYRFVYSLLIYYLKHSRLI